MTEVLPSYLQIHDNIQYDNSIERVEYEVIPCSKTTVVDLNNQSAQLIFRSNGEYIYRPSSIHTHIRPTIKFRTRNANANDADTNITLANNYFLYMLAKVTLKLGGTVIEDYNYPGIVSDTLFHLDKKYRGYEGELYSFIPDNSMDADRRQVLNAAIAGGGAVPANHVTNNPNYNNGFDKRMHLYNYTVAAAATERENYPVIPLSHLFGYLKEVDIVYQYIPMEIELIREKNANKPRAYFGAAATNMTFDAGANGNPPTLGIAELNLILEKPSPRPDLKVKLEQEFKKTIKTPYLRRFCDELDIGNNATASWKKSFDKATEGVARYVCVVFKPTRDETPQTNFQLCPHCNIEEISVTYAGNKYPHLAQNGDFNRNNFTVFYNSYLKIAKDFGANEPGLSMDEFRDLYTHYWIDVSAQPVTSSGGELTVKIKRRGIPANNDDQRDPVNVTMYIIVFTECLVEIDCQRKTAKIG